MVEIEELLKRGFSKYRIAKETGVSWNTVQLWSKGIYKPKLKHSEKIKKLLIEKE